VQDPSPLSPLTQICLGLFGGAAATLTWELLIKPGRERRSLARAIAGEMELNHRQLAAHIVMLDAMPQNIPGDFSLSTVVFEAVAPRLGELNAELIFRLVVTYGMFRSLNRLASQVYPEAVKEFRALKPDDPAIRRQRQFLDGLIGIYGSHLRDGATRTKEALALLRKRTRVWFLPEPKIPTFGMDTIERDVTALMAQRARERGEA
jgi:hypothetical protein